jgi:hypothetical protein
MSMHAGTVRARFPITILTASSRTIAPLVGGDEPVPPAPSSASRACTGRLVLHLKPARGDRIVRVDVYLDGRRVLRRRGRSLTTVNVRGVSPAGHKVKVVTVSARGRTRSSTRRYPAC